MREFSTILWLLVAACSSGDTGGAVPSSGGSQLHRFSAMSGNAPVGEAFELSYEGGVSTFQVQVLKEVGPIGIEIAIFCLGKAIGERRGLRHICAMPDHELKEGDDPSEYVLRAQLRNGPPCDQVPVVGKFEKAEAKLREQSRPSICSELSIAAID